MALAGCGADERPPPASTSGAPAAAQSPLRERFDRLVSGLLSERGLEQGVIGCALGELAETVDDEQIEAATARIRKAEAVPPEIAAAAAAAGEACAGG